MRPTRALAFLCNLTADEWNKLEINDTMALWTKFRDYVMNNFQDIESNARVEAAWKRCKAIIEQSGVLDD